MYNCTVMKQARIRATHSIWAEAYEMLPIGYGFETDTITSFIDTVNDFSIVGVWAKLPDGRWTAIRYNSEDFISYSEQEPISSAFPVRGIVMHDYEIWGVSRPEHIGAPARITGLPEVHKLVKSDRIKLTSSLQFFWYGLMQTSVGSSMSEKNLISAWKSITHGGRAFTNGAGSNTHADYVGKKNLNKTPMLLEPIICGGTLIEIIGEAVKYGEQCWTIRTLNSSNFNYGVTKQLFPQFVFAATNSIRKVLPNGTRQVDPFWQLGGRDVPVPIITKDSDVNWIQKYKVRLLGPQELVPSPYNR